MPHLYVKEFLVCTISNLIRSFYKTSIMAAKDMKSYFYGWCFRIESSSVQYKGLILHYTFYSDIWNAKLIFTTCIHLVIFYQIEYIV